MTTIDIGSKFLWNTGKTSGGDDEITTVKPIENELPGTHIVLRKAMRVNAK